MLELQRPQPVSQPFVQLTKDPRRLCQTEIILPAWDIVPQALRDFAQIAATSATRQLPDARLEGRQRFGRHRAFELAVGGYPKAVAEKLPARHAPHRGFAVIDLQMQTLIAAPQSGQYPFARALTAHIDIAVIGVTYKALTVALQHPIHFVQQHIGQQRRQRSALRRPLVARADHAVIHDAATHDAVKV